MPGPGRGGPQRLGDQLVRRLVRVADQGQRGVAVREQQPPARPVARVVLAELGGGADDQVGHDGRVLPHVLGEVPLETAGVPDEGVHQQGAGVVVAAGRGVQLDQSEVGERGERGVQLLGGDTGQQ
ncbi:hypothetical protein [Streptomyces sp. SAI-124]|uniref:hypothetical protein n=1 Tax=Streptomyces sp. SAI-124 TaxID=3377730 RepID=UPI003C7D71C6